MRTPRLVVVGTLVIGAVWCFLETAEAAFDLRELFVREQALSNCRGFDRLPRARRSAVESAPGTASLEPLEDPPEVEQPAVSPADDDARTLPVAAVRAKTSPRRHRVRPPPAVETAPAPEEAMEPTLPVEPEDAIRMALRHERAAFTRCYEQELKKQAAFNGFVVVALSLSSEGRVTAAHIEEGNARDRTVGACIVGRLLKLRLPALSSEAELIVPIRLEAVGPT